MKGLATALLIATAAAAPAEAGLQITHVFHAPAVIEIERDEAATIHFRLSEPARATTHVWDGRDVLIRSIEAPDVLVAGDHEIRWDGLDARGRAVPPEAYHYTIEAVPPGGEPVVWDMTDLTGGERVKVVPPNWNDEDGVVEYAVRENARVRIRIGLDNGGPLLHTLIDWVPRARGAHAEPWDDSDVAGVPNLAAHPQLAFELNAFSLPVNTILVGPRPSRVALIDDLPEPTVQRDARLPARKRMLDFARQSIEARRDFPVDLELPATLGLSPEGLPIVSGRVPVRLGVDDSNQALLMNERFEAVFYLDGRFVWESEVAFFPLTWHFETRGMSPGVHYLSVNLRGYEGHFGVGTRALFVEPTTERSEVADE